jgi:hypothetical protein
MRRIVLSVALSILTSMVSVAVAAEYNSGQSNPGLTTAVIERTLTYQGILKDNTGSPVPDNTYNVTFRLYDLAAGGSALWNSGALAVTTSDGYFIRELGPIGLPFDRPYYLSLQVASDAEMTARQKVTMTAYSAVSDTANYAFAAPGGGSHWNLSTNNVLYSNDYWGIAKGNAGNTVRGDSARTMVNLGVFSYTGAIGNPSYCTIGGGLANGAYLSNSTVSGGRYNIAMGLGSFVGGGVSDTAKGYYSGCVSGNTNMAGDALSDTAAFVGGGSYNNAIAMFSGVASGKGNSAIGEYCFVGSGEGNTSAGSHSFVGGGENNTARGYDAVVGGGYENSACTLSATVGGGEFNTADGRRSTVCGGSENSADGEWATVGGGIRNRAWGSISAVCGGDDNAAIGHHSTILGGSADTISGGVSYSLIFGGYVYCNDDFRVIFFDSLYDGSLNINRDCRDGAVNSYPIQVGTSSSNGNGAYLSAGGNWVNGSSRTFKENFQPMDGSELLSRISNLSIVSYNYKNSTEKHFGPMAEDFVGAFDTGVIRESDGKRDDMYLSSGDVAGVALAGVQELLKIIEEQNKKIDKLEAEINQLKGR